MAPARDDRRAAAAGGVCGQLRVLWLTGAELPTVRLAVLAGRNDNRHTRALQPSAGKG